MAPDSQVETFAAVRLHIDTWRGGCALLMGRQATAVHGHEVLVALRRPPQAVFDEIKPEQSNYFRFRSAPMFDFPCVCAKCPGIMVGERLLVVRHHSGDEMSPYENLSATSRGVILFARKDAVELLGR